MSFFSVCDGEGTAFVDSRVSGLGSMINKDPVHASRPYPVCKVAIHIFHIVLNNNNDLGIPGKPQREETRQFKRLSIY